MNWYKRILIANKAAYTDMELLEALRPWNVEIYRKSSGSKRMLINLNNDRKAPFHEGHAGKTYGEGLVKKMLERLGIDEKEFYRYHNSTKRQQRNFFAPKKVEPEIEDTEEIPDYQNSQWFQEQLQFSSDSSLIKKAKKILGDYNK